MTVPNKEGTLNTVWLCMYFVSRRSLPGRVTILARPSMYASSQSCSITELTRLVYRQVRSSTSVTFAGHEKTRTAEVTICMISQRLHDRPRQLPHASCLPGCRKRRPRCHYPGYRNVLLMVVHHDIRTEPLHEINDISRCRGNHSSRAERFGQLDSNETRATLASRHDDRGFRGPRSARFLQTLQLVPPTMGIVASACVTVDVKNMPTFRVAGVNKSPESLGFTSLAVFSCSLH